MDQIIITIETTSQFKLDVLINDIPTDHVIDNDRIVIKSNVPSGVNLLTLRAKDHDQQLLIKLKDFILNEVSARQTLYLAYTEQPKKTCSTWMTELSNSLVIPFGNPMSWWLTVCASKIPNKEYGSNLYEKYQIFYPESVDVADPIPKLVKDFMKHDFNFHVVDISQMSDPVRNHLVPFVKVNLKYNEDVLYNEFLKKIDLLNSSDYAPKQNSYNNKETQTANPWRVSMAVKTNNTNDWKSTIQYSYEDFPNLYSLLEQIDSIGGIRIVHAFVGQVDSGSYVAPHIDDLYQYHPSYTMTDGCSNFYIPIGWTVGNYFKFSSVGLVPYDQGALLINNSQFTHASVNSSDKIRFTIGVSCEFINTNIKNYINFG